MCAKCLQIDLLPGATEHLLGTEGLDEPCSERLPANGSVSPLHNRVVLAHEGSGDLGTGLGDRTSSRDGPRPGRNSQVPPAS